MRNKPIFYLISIAIILAALFDIYSTIRYRNFMVLEINPVMVLLGNNLWVLWLMKIIVVSLLIIFLRYVELSKSKALEYSAVYTVIILTIMQVVVAFSNMQIHETITEKEGFAHPSEIPIENIAKYSAPTSYEKIKRYFVKSVLPLLFPFIVALLSFGIWTKLYMKEWWMDENT